ncbi:hypothetical protein IWX90DRAFT_446718 [Phyllosticta citrichinensis]|uniref:Uncharacterized protein n=1 Tax=Phyllosticta citrichinensis TaxID=1130410 RepID=A0ABR1XEP7_9PEZI
MQIKALTLMVIFTLSCAYALPAAQQELKADHCRRQGDLCTPREWTSHLEETCCGRLVCNNEGNFKNICRTQQIAGCLAERSYCGINGPDLPCCGTNICRTRGSNPNKPFLCLPEL